MILAVNAVSWEKKHPRRVTCLQLEQTLFVCNNFVCFAHRLDNQTRFSFSYHLINISETVFTPIPGKNAKCCDDYGCSFVHSRISRKTRTNFTILRMLPVVVGLVYMYLSPSLAALRYGMSSGF